MGKKLGAGVFAVLGGGQSRCALEMLKYFLIFQRVNAVAIEELLDAIGNFGLTEDIVLVEVGRTDEVVEFYGQEIPEMNLGDIARGDVRERREVGRFRRFTGQIGRSAGAIVWIEFVVEICVGIGSYIGKRGIGLEANGIVAGKNVKLTTEGSEVVGLRKGKSGLTDRG